MQPVDNALAVFERKVDGGVHMRANGVVVEILFRVKLVGEIRHAYTQFEGQPKQAIKQLLRKIRYFNLDIHKINEQILAASIEVPYESGSHCSQIPCTETLDKQYYEKKFFEEYIDLEFEGNQFKAIKEWDTALSIVYGKNYMQPPPPKDREQHSLDCNRFYWKEK